MFKKEVSWEENVWALEAQRPMKEKSLKALYLYRRRTGHREAKNNTFRLLLGTYISCYNDRANSGSMLALDSSNTGKYLAFDSLEEGTATGGDVGNLVGHTKLVDASY